MKHKKGFSAAMCACLLAMLGVLAGCSAQEARFDEDMLGVPRAEADRMTITITCNSTLDHFAAEVEARFPGIRLVQDCYTCLLYTSRCV